MLRGDKVIEQLNRDFEGVHLPREVEKILICNARAAERERCAEIADRHGATGAIIAQEIRNGHQ